VLWEDSSAEQPLVFLALITSELNGNCCP
jgi:hypothetical protein